MTARVEAITSLGTLGRVLPVLGRTFVDVRRARARVQAPAMLPLLYVEVTRACNARCGMCGFATDYPRLGQEMRAEELLAIMDAARELGVEVVSLGGGEPFLRRDTDSLIERIAALGMTPLVHTNGALVDKERRERLARLPRLVMAFSLDAASGQRHDEVRQLACFEELTSAAAYFVRHAAQTRVVLTFTITATNYREMLPAAKLAADLGVNALRFAPFHENLQHRHKPGSALAPYRVPPAMIPAIEDALAEARSFLRGTSVGTNSDAYLDSIPAFFRGRVPHDCYAGFMFASIDPFGNLFPCYDHVGTVNVRRVGLAAAFRGPEMDRLRADVVGCDHRCWNVGTAEPSLRLDPSFVLRNMSLLMREALFFLV